MPLPAHYLRVGAVERELQPGQVEPERERRDIEPWLSAVFQSKHLSLLLGSGLPVAVAALGEARPAPMSVPDFNVDGQDLLLKRASTLATQSGRGDPLGQTSRPTAHGDQQTRIQESLTTASRLRQGSFRTRGSTIRRERYNRLRPSGLPSS
jgi:hypothetical protein